MCLDSRAFRGKGLAWELDCVCPLPTEISVKNVVYVVLCAAADRGPAFFRSFADSKATRKELFATDS